MTLLMLSSAIASERPEHFQGEASSTVSEALSNLAQYNARLERLLAQDSLNAKELAEVHQMSYTLENALARLEETLEEGKQSLERVHLASEASDSATVRNEGRVYLDAITTIIGP